MARITLVRDSGYTDAIRDYTILLDGKQVASLKSGATASVDVAAGEHSITAKIDWCGSQTLRFSIREDESASFAVASNLRGLRMFLAIWYIIADRDNYLSLTRVG